MRKFTVEEYDAAIAALQRARQQVIDGTQGEGCGICGDACHPDMCGWNPLYAQYVCTVMTKQCEELHETLHWMTGFNTYMGEAVGVASIRPVLPDKIDLEQSK